MKRLFIVPVLAVLLSGCGVAAKVNARHDMEASKVAYKECLAQHVEDAAACDGLRQAYEAATAKGLWKGTAAGRDPVGYWVAGVEAYFDASGDVARPPLADGPVVTREALKAYDPDLHALVEETMAYREHVDWRYRRPAPRE